MKILHVIPSVSPQRGGPSFVLRKLAAGLLARGVEVEIATTNDDGAARVTQYVGDRVEEGVRVHYFPRQVERYTVSAPLCRWVWAQASRFDVMHVHALFSFPSDMSAWIGGRRGVPYVIRPLGVLNQWGMVHRRPRLKQAMFQRFYRPLLEGAASIHYTSEQERDEATLLGFHSHSVIIPNPIDLPSPRPDLRGRFRQAYPELGDKPMVLFLSRLDPKKGLDLLVTAFGQTLAAKPEARLVIGGTGDVDFLAKIRALADCTGIGNRIVWTGFLEGDLKTAALLDADVYVLPSYSENFGVAPVEAMAAGLPVVITNQVGIHPDVAEFGAGVVVNPDATEVADAILRILGDRQLGARLGAGGSKLVHERYATASVTNRLIGLYERIRRH